PSSHHVDRTPQERPAPSPAPVTNPCRQPLPSAPLVLRSPAGSGPPTAAAYGAIVELRSQLGRPADGAGATRAWPRPGPGPPAAEVEALGGADPHGRPFQAGQRFRVFLDDRQRHRGVLLRDPPRDRRRPAG